MNNKEEKSGKSKDDEIFDAPPVPPPKRKTSVPQDSQELSKTILERIKMVESEGNKAILIDCDRCKKKVVVPISKATILKSNTKYLTIAYIHKYSKKDNPHCLLFELDRETKVQLSKATDAIFSTQKDDKAFQKLVKRDVYIYCERWGATLTITIPEYMVKES